MRRDVVKLGVIQVMEGRHTFEHLTVEDDLLTGAYTRGREKGIRQTLENGLRVFPQAEGTPACQNRIHIRR